MGRNKPSPPALTCDEMNQDDTADKLLANLVAEFGTRLDESLIHAVACDHNIVTEYNAIRSVLVPLASSALVEEATGFDPSGLGSTFGTAIAEDDATGSSPETAISTSKTSHCRHEAATTSSDMSDVSEEPFTYQTDMSVDEKVGSLLEIFSNFKNHTIRFILKQNDGNMERSFDDLLNRVHLEETGQLEKGLSQFDRSRSFSALKARRKRNQGKDQQIQMQVNYRVVSPKTDPADIERDTSTISRSANTNTKMVSATRVDVWQTSTAKRPSSQPSADVFLSSRNWSASQAAALHRRGAASPLYRAAAAVYAQRTHDDNRALNSFTAEQIVDLTSTPFQIDLHGVTVMDGVLIAKTRTQRWWNELGEERARLARETGFTVITGIGKHSANGVSRLRQAVGQALKNDGWKVDTLTGKFYVTGRVNSSG